MKLIPTIKKYLPYILLLVIILFNFYLYRSEFKVLSDPNDGAFHFALIDEAKNIWKEVFKGKLSPLYLLDSWNERWAEGFPLSLYYSHLPETTISLLSFIVPISTFKLMVIIRTLLIILLPVSFFFGAIIMGFSAGFGVIFAFFSQAIFTDGLYGLDAPSFLWRGWGLFTQLLAVFILPLAFGYGIDYLKTKRNLGKAILFNFLLAEAHFGMFYLLLFSYPVFWLFSLDQWYETGKRILTFILLTFLTLLYFIFPFFSTSQYRNFSLWDPIWKFNSWGVSQIIIWLSNGDLFDFNRFPFLTIVIIGGVFWGLLSKNKLNRYLVTIFCLYFIFFLGRDVLGPLVNLIPGLSEYHLHRVIVMVQFAGLLFASGFLYSILQSITNARYRFFQPPHPHGGPWRLFLKRYLRVLEWPFVVLLIILISFSIYLIEKPIVNYAKDNDTWIARSNVDYQKNINDYQAITTKLKELPSARIYAGRPGNWGRDFRIGDTQIYMTLSGDGFPIIGFLPESWSPNSDTEQFFDEENIRSYELYNVGYLVLPVDKKAPKFAKLVIKKGKFSLYKIDSEGWFTLGKSSLEVAAKKENLVNITHIWIGSPMYQNKNYPVIALNNENFTFVDTVMKMDGQNTFNGNRVIWHENPMYSTQEKFEQTLLNKVEKKFPQGYSVNFKLKDQCNNCVVILKQTFHPNWNVTINGKTVKAFPIFPFFIGIQVNQPGDYQITATYKSSGLKTFFIAASIIIFIFVFKWLRKYV
ncbi:MAG: hypothetical protein WCT34_02890 [Patescibacteria group bacterium]